MPPTPGVPGGLEMPPGRHGGGDRGSGCWGSLSPELCKHIRTGSPSAQDWDTTAPSLPAAPMGTQRGVGTACGTKEPASPQRSLWHGCGEEQPRLIWRQDTCSSARFPSPPLLRAALRAHHSPLAGSPLAPSTVPQPPGWFAAMRPA